MRKTLAWAGLFCLLAAPATAQDRAGFLLRAGNDTLSVELFSRTDGGVRGRLLVRKRLPVTYEASVRADGTVSELAVAVLQPDAPPEALPRQQASLRFTGDSVIAHSRTGDSTSVERFATRPGALPYHAQVPMVALLEQIVRRARVIGGDSVSLPVFVLGGGGRTLDASIVFRGDTAVVRLGTLHARLAVDAQGRVLGGRAQADQVIERLASVPDRLLSAQVPDYSAPAGAPYRAEEVRITTRAGHVLAGTLTLPLNARGRVPAVVTITGSSAQDRDHNTQFGAPIAEYRR